MREYLYIVKVKIFEEWASREDFELFLEELNKHNKGVLEVEIVKSSGGEVEE